MAKAKGDRDQAGRFLPGHGAPGPGRPRREVEREYLDVTMGAVSLEDWRLVTVKALEDAKAGDPKAREWLSKYLLPAVREDEGDGTATLLMQLALMRKEIEGR